MIKDFNIKAISTKETYSIRQTVLRPGKPLRACKFNGDDAKNTVHFGAYINHTCVGIATLMANNSTYFKENKQYQLRGMAILPEYRGLKLGKAILNTVEKHLHKKNIVLLWFNARELAVNFYKANNYKTYGDYFNIENVGTHIIMYKPLVKNI